MFLVIAKVMQDYSLTDVSDYHNFGTLGDSSQEINTFPLKQLFQLQKRYKIGNWTFEKMKKLKKKKLLIS